MIGFRVDGLWMLGLVWLAVGVGCADTEDRNAKVGKVVRANNTKTSLEIDSFTKPKTVDPIEAAPVFVAPDLPPKATLLDPDMVWNKLNPTSFAISPDGQWIAYISKGAIWQCRVTAGPPTKLADLPNTVTEFRSTSNYRKKRGDFNKLDSNASDILFYNRPKKGLTRVVGLKWTPSQDGVFYTLGSSLPTRPWTATYRVMHASTQGVLTTIATISRNTHDEPHRLYSFDVTHDRSLVVASNGYTPLIWDASTDKPLATCFDDLLPSSTSGRFIGIEIDTRQLVITDENLKIKKRLDVFFSRKPYRFNRMFWSPDERFAICVSRLDHPDHDKWTGFRINLETEEQRPLEAGRITSWSPVEDYVPDQFAFTGRGGEFVRATSTSLVGLGFVSGGSTYLATMPDGVGPPKDIYRFQQLPWPREEYRRKKPYPPVRFSEDATLFAMALPREEKKLGYRYWLIDRDGNKWPMGPEDPSLYVSPYHVVAIADNGRQVIACDDVQLFSIPVASIQNAEETQDE